MNDKTYVKIYAVMLAMVLVLGGLTIGKLSSPPPARAASQFANIICDQFKAVSTSANVQINTAGNANMFIYICGYNLTNGNAAAGAVSIVEGTGTTCATNTLAMVGNSTAAGGLALQAAGGSANLGGGSGAVARTAVAGDNVCVFTAAGPIGGAVAMTQANF